MKIFNRSILNIYDDKGNKIPIPAIKGDKGLKGDKGDKGDKPVKGVDYFTPAEIEQIEQASANKVKVPTKTSELTNDSNFIISTVDDLVNYYKKSETYTQNEINQKISAIPKFAIEVVSTLPTENISLTTIYLKTTGVESENIYTEYIYVNNKWEKLGTQKVDLTGYALKTDIPTKVSELTNDIGYLTQHQSLTDYAKKSDLTPKADKSYVDSELAKKQNAGDYVTKATNGTVGQFAVSDGKGGITWKTLPSAEGGKF